MDYSRYWYCISLLVIFQLIVYIQYNTIQYNTVSTSNKLTTKITDKLREQIKMDYCDKIFRLEHHDDGQQVKIDDKSSYFQVL